MALANLRIDQLPPSAGAQSGYLLAMLNKTNGLTESIPVDSFMQAEDNLAVFEWVSGNDPGYVIGEVVTYGGKWWQSLINDNLNVVPGTDSTKWLEVNKSPSGFVAWQAGVFTATDTYVLNTFNGFTQLFRLIDPTRPFVSSNFSLEYAQGKWDLMSERSYLSIQKNAHGFALLDVLTFKSGDWNKSGDSDLDLGIVLQVVDANNVVVGLLGQRINLIGLTPGSVYYGQSDSTISTAVSLRPLFLAVTSTQAITFASKGVSGNDSFAKANQAEAETVAEEIEGDRDNEKGLTPRSFRWAFDAVLSWVTGQDQTITGTWTAPTAALGTNTQQIATTEFVQTEIAIVNTNINSIQQDTETLKIYKMSNYGTP